MGGGRGRAGPGSAHRVGPVGVVGLLPQRTFQVKVLGVVGGLGSRVADVALGVEPLSDLHGMLWPHACERQEAQLARNARVSQVPAHGPGHSGSPKSKQGHWESLSSCSSLTSRGWHLPTGHSLSM